MGLLPFTLLHESFYKLGVLTMRALLFGIYIFWLLILENSHVGTLDGPEDSYLEAEGSQPVLELGFFATYGPPHWPDIGYPRHKRGYAPKYN